MRDGSIWPHRFITICQFIKSYFINTILKYILFSILYLLPAHSQKHSRAFSLALTPEKPQVEAYHLVGNVREAALIYLMYILM